MPKMIDFPGPLNSGIPLHYHILSVLAFPTEERKTVGIRTLCFIIQAMFAFSSLLALMQAGTLPPSSAAASYIPYFQMSPDINKHWDEYLMTLRRD